MAKITAYHTNSPEYGPENRTVYHDHGDCFEGKKIEQVHRVVGSDGRPRCKQCIKLG
jgi:hypothetical protein